MSLQDTEKEQKDARFTFLDIIRMWFEGEPLLQKHMRLSHIDGDGEGEWWFYFFVTCCQRGHSLAFMSLKEPVATHINWYVNEQAGLHGVYQPAINAKDPQFFEKLKSGLIVAHNSLTAAKAIECVLTPPVQ